MPDKKNTMDVTATVVLSSQIVGQTQAIIVHDELQRQLSVPHGVHCMSTAA